MKKHDFSLILVIFIIVSILMIPCVIFSLISNSNVTDFIKNKLDIKNADFISSLLTYCALFFNLLLSIIVFFQGRRINKLSVKNYDCFIGIDNIDKEYDFVKDQVLHPNEDSFIISYSITNNTKVITASILDKKDIKYNNELYYFPLSFITKNKPLITSISFDKAIATLRNSDNTENKNIVAKNTKDETIKAILHDNEHFILALGVICPKRIVFDTISIDFYITIHDQYGYAKKTKVESCFVKDRNGEFYLSSSYST